MRKTITIRLPVFWLSYLAFAFAMMLTIVASRALEQKTASFAENAIIVVMLVICGMLMQIFYERNKPRAPAKSKK
ncbi:MAG: hypothetical protein V4603_04050 [Pseudomonadota bacterium]